MVKKKQSVKVRPILSVEAVQYLLALVKAHARNTIFTSSIEEQINKDVCYILEKELVKVRNGQGIAYKTMEGEVPLSKVSLGDLGFTSSSSIINSPISLPVEELQGELSDKEKIDAMSEEEQIKFFKQLQDSITAGNNVNKLKE